MQPPESPRLKSALAAVTLMQNPVADIEVFESRTGTVVEEIKGVNLRDFARRFNATRDIRKYTYRAKVKK